jgi:hypothetical protein
MTPAEFTAWRDALGGRRFFVAVGAGLMQTALLYLGHIDQYIFRDLTIAIVASYVTGATIQRVKNHASSTQPTQ